MGRKKFFSENKLFREKRTCSFQSFVQFLTPRSAWRSRTSRSSESAEDRALHALGISTQTVRHLEEQEFAIEELASPSLADLVQNLHDKIKTKLRCPTERKAEEWKSRRRSTGVQCERTHSRTRYATVRLARQTLNSHRFERIVF